MIVQKFCAISAVLALTACATAQENPNYQFSSKYEGEASATQMASNSSSSNVVYVSPEARAAELNGTTEQTTTQATSQPQVSYANSTTEQNSYPERVSVVTSSQIGTPGYGAYIPENVENYDYSENIVSTNSQISVQTDPAEIRSFEARPSANYVVGSGDTVYNISRRLCVDVEDVQAPNALGNDFAINIGQPLYLPPSRC
ncbi:LysM peptidoglycan-binding domain-containing protein [Litorimonas haliclonae]|uniref:LysM peptidoglycan-binding domain-containing protein n=1 Tax=Litorimonas haliclonae TaxID=2081977 RepID=UPI0039EF50E2